MLLNPGFDLTLRPMKYPVFYEMYRNAIKNTAPLRRAGFTMFWERQAAGPKGRHCLGLAYALPN